MKIRTVEAELFHADGRSVGYDEANSRFSQFCEGILNCYMILLLVSTLILALGSCDHASRAKYEEREKTNKMQESDVYCQLLSQHVSGIIMPIFRRTKIVCYCIWCIVLVLLDVLASYNAAPHNRYQPHPAEQEQYTKCSNTRSSFS